MPGDCCFSPFSEINEGQRAVSLRDFSGFGEFNLKLKELNFISLGMFQLLLRLAENKLSLLFQHGAAQCCAEHCVSQGCKKYCIFYSFSSLSWGGMKKER